VWSLTGVSIERVYLSNTLLGGVSIERVCLSNTLLGVNNTIIVTSRVNINEQ